MDFHICSASRLLFIILCYILCSSYFERNLIASHHGSLTSVTAYLRSQPTPGQFRPWLYCTIQMRMGTLTNSYYQSTKAPRRGAVQSVIHILLECTKFNKTKAEQSSGKELAHGTWQRSYLARRAAILMAGTGLFGELGRHA